MDSNEILNRFLSIEATTKEIYKEVIKIRKENKDRMFEILQMRVFLEDVYDFIKLMTYEKNNSENIENK